MASKGVHNRVAATGFKGAAKQKYNIRQVAEHVVAQMIGGKSITIAGAAAHGVFDKTAKFDDTAEYTGVGTVPVTTGILDFIARDETLMTVLYDEGFFRKQSLSRGGFINSFSSQTAQDVAGNVTMYLMDQALGVMQARADKQPGLKARQQPAVTFGKREAVPNAPARQEPPRNDNSDYRVDRTGQAWLGDCKL